MNNNMLPVVDGSLNYSNLKKQEFKVHFTQHCLSEIGIIALNFGKLII